MRCAGLVGDGAPRPFYSVLHEAWQVFHEAVDGGVPRLLAVWTARREVACTWGSTALLESVARGQRISCSMANRRRRFWSCTCLNKYLPQNARLKLAGDAVKKSRFSIDDETWAQHRLPQHRLPQSPSLNVHPSASKICNRTSVAMPRRPVAAIGYQARAGVRCSACVLRRP